MKEEDKNKTARDFTKDRNKFLTVADWIEDGMRILIASTSGRHFVAYIGLPVEHPLSNKDYENIPVRCHGGLTFSGVGDGDYRPKGYYWYGLYIGYGINETNKYDDKDWTLGEVKDDLWETIIDMSSIKRLAEQIYTEARAKS